MEITKKFAAKAADNKSAAITLAFLGDSVTQGCFELLPKAGEGFLNVFDRQNVYHTYLQQILSVLYPSVPVNVINAGVAGTSAPFGLERLERDVLCHKPDLTVVCFGLNDSGGGEAGISRYTDALSQIFDKLRENGSEVIFMTPNMMASHVSSAITQPAFIALGEKFSKRQAKGIMDQYVAAAKALCREKNVPVCDCYGKWKALEANGVNTTELLANKMNHPIRPMHWLFAMSLVEIMMTE